MKCFLYTAYTWPVFFSCSQSESFTSDDSVLLEYHEWSSMTSDDSAAC